MAGAPASALTVTAVDPLTDPRWDAYVDAHPRGLLFHSSSWVRTLLAEYDQPVTALVAEDGAGTTRGVLPLLATRGVPLAPAGVAGRRLSSLPRTPVAGPLGDDDAALAALLEAAVARTPPGAQLQVKADDAPPAGLVEGLAAHPWRLAYAIALPDDPARVRFGNSRNHQRIRWAVGKAEREGVVVRPADGPGDVSAWYRLYLDTMRTHAVPPRPLRLFEAMWRHLRPQGRMRLLLAEHHGRLVAGSVLLMHGSTVFYAFNGVRRDALGLRPNDVLQWRAIHDAAAEGFRRYDLGEVVEHHEGLAAFKRKWGADERRLWRLYSPPPETPPDPGDADRGRTLLLAERLWRRVPLRATAVAGDGVFRLL